MQVTSTALDDAIKALRRGDADQLGYIATKKVLTESPEYDILLEEAAVVSFHKASVEVGIIAGLKLAVRLLNQNIEFAEETK